MYQREESFHWVWEQLRKEKKKTKNKTGEKTAIIVYIPVWLARIAFQISIYLKLLHNQISVLEFNLQMSRGVSARRSPHGWQNSRTTLPYNWMGQWCAVHCLAISSLQDFRNKIFLGIISHAHPFQIVTQIFDALAVFVSNPELCKQFRTSADKYFRKRCQRGMLRLLLCRL